MRYSDYQRQFFQHSITWQFDVVHEGQSQRHNLVLLTQPTLVFVLDGRVTPATSDFVDGGSCHTVTFGSHEMCVDVLPAPASAPGKRSEFKYELRVDDRVILARGRDRAR